MATFNARLTTGTALSFLLSTSVLVGVAQAQQTAAEGEEPVVLGTIVLSAEDQIKQALGVSTITAEDLAKTPVVNDVAEIIRKQPGINLTGNSASGARGNNRQIDIRGMGPENTLILIDGKPVTSRNAVKMGRQAERDTRGDSNWVPAELIERIEVIRGPAAARYGSGAAGGVVNIITKRPDEQTGSVGVHFNQPDSDLEGSSRRANFMFAGPMGETLSYRVFGNVAKSKPDSVDLNADASADAGNGTQAGREGVLNKDIGANLRWTPNGTNTFDLDLGWSRQTNAYSGDSNAGTILDPVPGVNIGDETNRMERRTLGVTHRGDYGFGETFSYLQWEGTANTRNGVSTGGSPDNISTAEKSTIDYDSITAKTELTTPMSLAGRDSMLTLGAEYRGEFLEDQNRLQTGNINNGDPLRTEQHQLGIYAEANIMWSEKLTLTPGLRYDYGDTYGSNWSPSLNATYEFDDAWSMKMGVARAFKAPNLFQMAPGYLYSTMGMGCPTGVTAPCLIEGNPDLDPEISVNKELGVAYDDGNGLAASLTWFRNDYSNRIAPGLTELGLDADGRGILRWENTPNAVVEGIEGNFSTKLGEDFGLNVNFTKMITSESEVRDNTGAIIKNPLSLVPKHTINASLDWQAREDLAFTLSATHYGKIEAAKYSVHTGKPADQTGARGSYTLVNLGMNWDLTEETRLSAGVTNVFNKSILRTGDGANNFNEPGRAFYLGLNHNF